MSDTPDRVAEESTACTTCATKPALWCCDLHHRMLCQYHYDEMCITSGADPIRCPLRDKTSPDRKVLVGRTYSSLNSQWAEWDDPFDQVVAKMTERKEDGKVNDAPDEILEVIVVRRVVLKGTIEATEVAVP